MSQPTPDLPLVSDTACWSTNTKMETEISARLYRSTRGSEGGKCVPCPLRPAPLFRSIGLTGLSASLPPHRRLRSILHRARAVRPDNANETNKAQGGSNANTLISDATDRGLPFKDFLPEIMTQKLRPSQTHQETRTRGSRSIRDTKTFSSFQSQAESRLNPNNNLTDTFQSCHSMGHQDPSSKTYTSRRTIVFPLTQSDTHSAATTETPVSANRKRWSRKIRQILTSEKGSDEQDISECFHNLVITDDHPSSNRKNLKASGSPKSNRNELDSEHEGKGACHTRRDRRPHFLPPISQSGCLLDVPFVLPENSPPPSPSSVFSTPFFPLSVPVLPVRPQHGKRDT
ncbi:uncharacterized protein LOC113534792 [Pangasianodon hypophthalmus]|uniref:uncharacterized protein LOC113534792 n=1 Tax=Pangasianodon hypophthalmus TaxID=310915 RepID=UPI00230758A2|nr:uncharacterized protein LOC113534792 [Pangasianodon hypophthalmus]